MPAWLKKQSHRPNGTKCTFPSHISSQSSHLGISSINYCSVCLAVLAKNKTEEPGRDTQVLCRDRRGGCRMHARSAPTNFDRPIVVIVWSGREIALFQRLILVGRLDPDAMSVARSRSQGPRYLAAYSVRALDRLSNKAIAKIRQQRGSVCPFIHLPFFYATLPVW